MQRSVQDRRDGRLRPEIGSILVMRAWELTGREASPRAGVIDSQSVKTTQSERACGHDAGKKAAARKRHAVTGVLGLIAGALVDAADVRHCGGAPDVLNAIRARWPCLRGGFADAGHAGEKLQAALAGKERSPLEIIKRAGKAEGF